MDIIQKKGKMLTVGFRMTILILLTLLSSCGYGFTPAGGVVPKGAGTLAIPVFLNNTREPYADVEVTKAAVDEFIADGRLKVVSLESADLVLRGTVIKFEMIPQSYTADSYVQQYQVRIVVDARLEEVKSRQVLWQENGLSSVFVSSYPVAIGDITITKIAKEAALKKASKDVAWTIRSRVLEGF
jgi:hypothetical protein